MAQYIVISWNVNHVCRRYCILLYNLFCAQSQMSIIFFLNSYEFKKKIAIVSFHHSCQCVSCFCFDNVENYETLRSNV